MKLRTLLVLASFAAVFGTTAVADPAQQLRDLDQLLKEGRISQAEHDRRWREVLAAGINTPAPGSSSDSTVPRLNFKRPEPKRPPNEFSVSAGAGSIEAGSESETLLAATAMYGRFVTPNLQLALGVEYGRADFDGADLTTQGVVGAIDFHFMPTATFVPFVGLGASRTRIEVEGEGESESDSDWCWNVHAGLKQTLRADTAIRYQVTYFNHTDFDIEGVAATVGISWMF